MVGAVRCAGRSCKAGMLRLTTSSAGKMVVVTTQRTCKSFVPHATPRNFGLNTTQENNFQAVRLRFCWKINFKKSVQKKFSSKTSSDPLRIDRKKSVCLFVMPPLGGHPPLKRGSMPFCHATFEGVRMGGSIPQR